MVALVSVAVLLALTVGSRQVRGDGDDTQHVRWDIVSINFTAPLTVSAGGHASAKANDNSQITLTGSGTFVARGESGRGENHGVTGGGTWMTCNPAGTVCATGNYEVTGLVSWEPAPFPPGDPNQPRTDLIDPTATRSTGLAVLRITYSDGARGILIVSCTGATAPGDLFEGITATKGFVDYFNRVAPVGGVDANRTLFHIRADED
jgi:hypothetical protein